MAAGVLYTTPGHGWLWWCARRCRGARKNWRGQMAAVGPGAPDHQHRARAARAYRNSRLQLRARILAGKSLGFRRDKGPRVCGWRGIHVVPMPGPVSAGLLVPVGVLRSAGRSRSPWPGPQRLGAALKQVFILEFDRRNAPIIIKRMHTQVTKKHASECCVQLGVLAYANLMHRMHSYVHLYA